MRTPPIGYNPMKEFAVAREQVSRASAAPFGPVIVEDPTDSAPLLTVGADGTVKKAALYDTSYYDTDYYT